MSQDLVTYGIASSNLQPNTPSEDARPLLEAAVTFASKNNIATVTADPGSYYFLSLHAGTTTHAYLSGASNVTIDWQNSDLYFAFSNHAAITCQNCSTVTMQNFTLDYQQLPFTQVSITAVDSANGTLTFQTIPGYQSPSDFNTNRTSDNSDAIWIFIFRNGAPLAGVGRLQGVRPVNGNVITIASTNNPWASATALAAIQPGDVAVFTDRGGPPALNFVQGANTTVRDASIYSSGQIALYFGRTLAPTADHVQVIPRPGTTRLISSNADGIHTSFANGANMFSNNIVRRTCDDALAIASEWLATVSSAPLPASPATVTVTRSIVGVPYPEGTAVSFVNPADATVVGSATILSESPPSASQTLAAGESVAVTLDQPVTGLAAGYEMIYSDPAKHGAGSVIAGNLVQQGVFSRGVWLSGVDNVNVHDNLITQTSKIGIFVEQLTAPPGSGNLLDTGPSSGITVQNNLVDNSINYGGVSEGPVIEGASIQVLSLSGANGQVASTPNSNITIQNNVISNASRSAIRVENVASGQIASNSFQGYGLNATQDVYYAPSCCETVAQYKADFQQPLVVLNSTNVASPSNLGAESPVRLITGVSAASYVPKVAPDSLVAAFWNNAPVTTDVAPTPWPTTLENISVFVTDSTGTVRLAPIYYLAPTQFSFVLPVGTSPGLATVSADGFSGAVLVDAVAPGLYSQNSSGQGVAAATWALYSPGGSLLNSGLVAAVPCSPGGCVASPISLGDPTDQLYVSLYGTGLRGYDTLTNVHASIGGVAAQVQFIGAQGITALDQVNVLVPHSLAGAGEVPIVLTVDGQTANVVTISLQ